MKDVKDIEKSIIKKFRKNIWCKFTKGINLYNFVEDNDHIAVCISGGKDSFLLAKCLVELQKHGKIDFKLSFILMDPGYSDESLAIIKNNIKLFDLDVIIFKAEIFNYIETLDKGTPCYLCARMRRGHLYFKAQELGCNKIALGHHFDDVIETILLSMFYSAEIKTMMPKLHSQNYKDMELIRPLYLVKEQDILAWQKYNNLKFIHCACPLEKTKAGSSKREEIKTLINDLRKINPYIEQNIFKSVDNVNLKNIIGYKKDGEYTNFLDNY